MEFTRGDKLDFDPRLQLSRIFVDGFYIWLKVLSKDKEKLTKTFAHMFKLEYFYVAHEGETIFAKTACINGSQPITFDKKIFIQTLGFFRGRIAYFMLKKHLIRNVYPFELANTTGSIEFVATAPEAQGKGIARQLITFIMNNTPYASYVLEVVDTNAGAVHLYKKLGFKEIQRTKAPKGSGSNFCLYMQKDM
ncbi:MAG: GNAT family N-acetyltransferase [Defluviitaleaceae bacterium]|nr:GNAT family N-acetyltransferase [Defluviitaleaceae bacterium]